jgi:preprotein translocase subunit SecG
MILLFLVALFLILLVMVQRGKGGGLAGALGGMGGQSAFGTKAGDLFTRVTIIVAAVWIVLCMVCVRILSSGASDLLTGGTATPPASRGSANPGEPGPANSTQPAEATNPPAGAGKPLESGASGKPAPAGATQSAATPSGAKPATAK